MKTRYFSIALAITLITVSAPNVHAQWVQSNAPGSAGMQISSFAVSGTNLFVGFWGGEVWLSTDNGATMTPTSGPTGSSGRYVKSLAVSGSNTSPLLFAGTQGAGVFLTTDSGTTWSSASTGLTGNAKTVWALATIGTDLVAGTNAGIFRSTNNGTSWLAASSGLSGYGLYPRAFTVIGANTSSPILFAGTLGGVYRSTNNGSSWTNVSNGLTADTSVVSLAVIGANTSSPMLFAGTGVYRSGDAMEAGGVFLSSNNGTSWIARSIGLPGGNIDVNALAVSGTNLFAGTGYGVGYGEGIFLSTNNGTNWTAVSTGLTDTSVNALTVSGPNLLDGAGSGSGLWYRPLAEMISNAVAESPHTIQYAPQAYPNPFSGKTTITISPTESSLATITIVNLLGQEVASLFDGSLSVGKHSFTWDPESMPAGMYVCVVRSNQGVEELPIMCVK